MLLLRNKLLNITSFTLLESIVFPKAQLIAIMGIAMIIDFITGVTKARVLGEITSSSGYRKTIFKFLQYGGAIAIAMILANMSRYDGSDNVLVSIFTYLTNILVSFIIYIELTSILENICTIDPNSEMSNKLFKPLLNLFTFQFKKPKK